MDGALVHGFPTDTWTLSRIAAHIHHRFGVTLEESRVSEILHQLGFSKQKPERRSRKRDEKRVATWKCATLPALKKWGSREGRDSDPSTRAGSRTNRR